MNSSANKIPSIVLITGDDFEHRYMANRLASEIRLRAIVVDHGKKQRFLERINRLWRRYTIRELLSRITLAGLRSAWGDRVARERALTLRFSRKACSAFNDASLLRHVSGINTQQGQQLVESLEPDVLLVFGTGIVGNKVLSMARRIALNLHTGISPYYRGCDCSFWPVHNEELSLLGATVHECTKDVDGGKIFGTVQAKPEAGDGLFDIFARCVIAGAQLYSDTVQALCKGELHATFQDLKVGTEYKASMRGIRAEWRTRRKLKAGLIASYFARMNRPEDREASAHSAPSFQH